MSAMKTLREKVTSMKHALPNYTPTVPGYGSIPRRGYSTMAAEPAYTPVEHSSVPRKRYSMAPAYKPAYTPRYETANPYYDWIHIPHIPFMAEQSRYSMTPEPEYAPAHIVRGQPWQTPWNANGYSMASETAYEPAYTPQYMPDWWPKFPEGLPFPMSNYEPEKSTEGQEAETYYTRN